MAEEEKTSIYAVRTTTGQEKTVADMIASKAASKRIPIASVFVSEAIKGYIFVEAPRPQFVDEAISGMRHVRARTRGSVPIASLQKFIETKPVIEGLKVGDMVEVVGGPFRGMRAKITSIDKVKEEATIELLEEGFATLPITVHADYLKPVEERERSS
ncbi:MAG: transcription elongation factor Spt5 [Candidatus Bathyarchaeia archaeon]